MTNVRYAFYLRPSDAMCHAQRELHRLLQQQYGLRAAGSLMPHATIKGFFRSDAAPQDIVAQVDPVIAGRSAFPVHSRGVQSWLRSALVLDIQRLPDGSDNEALRALHWEAWQALAPLIHPACDFTPFEWHGDYFTAHLTLAMGDIPPPLFDEIEQFVHDAEPIGPPDFTADTLQLFAFRSYAWAGAWWEGLRWDLLHSWQLE
ncbi:MAG: 2'-5' RNA ligase family protein [Chloroflexota bacterium]|nr:2'-5' RNA ligase family protein [Chloroflexota bacterium]